MSSKFFNNDSANTLFDKLKGIAGNMANFDRFLAVVGFFSSSGYFKQMDADTSRRFFYTLNVLSDDKFNPHLHYARYRAVEFLKPEYRAKYRNAIHVGQTLAGIYRVHMVKRLESSFHAFKLSLATLLRITNDMLKMFAENKVIIAVPKVSDPQIIISETFI